MNLVIKALDFEIKKEVKEIKSKEKKKRNRIYIVDRDQKYKRCPYKECQRYCLKEKDACYRHSVKKRIMASKASKAYHMRKKLAFN